ncbi:hypothetical protein V8C34DRAFT_97326 [Trichoderma compactum]
MSWRGVDSDILLDLSGFFYIFFLHVIIPQTAYLLLPLYYPENLVSRRTWYGRRGCWMPRSYYYFFPLYFLRLFLKKLSFSLCSPISLLFFLFFPL